MLLKHNSKLSFIPFVRAKPALPREMGGLLQKNTPVAHRVPLAGTTGADQASCAA